VSAPDESDVEASPRVERARGVLYVVATPIGNLEDLTLRALRVLREVDAILAEDTRHTRKLCERHAIGTPLRAFHAHSPPQLVTRVVDELLAGGRLALVSDAGTPLVSDPGASLVAAAANAGVRVEALPGASAPLAALTVAGLRADGFRFVGFLPRSGARRRRALESLAKDAQTTVLFESPNRLADTLVDLAESAGALRRAAVCRELTKAYEEVARGTLAELAERFAEGTRGEVTIVVEGTGDEADAEETSDEAVESQVRAALASGASVRDAARQLAESTTLGKREAYQRVLAIAGESADDDAGEASD
jgi:16S rRNA (cytidine1402-2'-O)-methyltransferase